MDGAGDAGRGILSCGRRGAIVRAGRMRRVPFRSRMRSLRAAEGVGSGVEGWREVERYEVGGAGGGGVGERLKTGVEWRVGGLYEDVEYGRDGPGVGVEDDGWGVESQGTSLWRSRCRARV